MNKVKMKLSGGSWPPELEGEEVDVQISQIILPDGGMWTVDEFGYKAEPVNVEGGGKVASMKQLIGQDMTRLNIEFK